MQGPSLLHYGLALTDARSISLILYLEAVMTLGLALFIDADQNNLRRMPSILRIEECLQ